METRLIVGLGNPGKRYVGTRHNVGFMAVERLCTSHKARLAAHARIPGMVAEWKEKGLRWIALTPVTFMNLSGQAVVAAMNFWKIEIKSLLVVVDDVEVAAGGLRMRESGSAGGHNGLKSLIEHLGTRDFARLRVGIGRPPDGCMTPMADWLLQPFEKSELPWLEESINKASCAVESWALEGPATAMNRYNASGHPGKTESREAPQQN